MQKIKNLNIIKEIGSPLTEKNLFTGLIKDADKPSNVDAVIKIVQSYLLFVEEEVSIVLHKDENDQTLITFNGTKDDSFLMKPFGMIDLMSRSVFINEITNRHLLYFLNTIDYGLSANPYFDVPYKNLFTFRTESASVCDVDRADKLCDMMGLEVLKKEIEGGCMTYTFKTIEEYTPLALENEMSEVVYTNEVFLDTHRILQTLSGGTKPFEDWYNKHTV